jgi:hypothetical protein
MWMQLLLQAQAQKCHSLFVLQPRSTALTESNRAGRTGDEKPNVVDEHEKKAARSYPMCVQQMQVPAQARALACVEPHEVTDSQSHHFVHEFGPGHTATAGCSAGGRASGRRSSAGTLSTLNNKATVELTAPACSSCSRAQPDLRG